MRYSVLEYLEKSAKKYGDKTAVTDEHTSCSWKELKEGSMRAGSFLAKAVEPNQPVPVLAEKSIRTLEVFLGSVYAGAFYSLLNPQIPLSRQLQILSVLDVRILVTDREHGENAAALLQKLSEEGKNVPRLIFMEDILDTPLDEALLAGRQIAHIDTDPLYANFTSGSTGTPKGVLVGHRSVIDFIDCFTEEFGIDASDIIANQAPFDFDVSVKDIYSALKTGASLVLVPRRLFSNPAALLDFLCEHKVTNLTWAVSALCLISTFHGLEYRCPDTIRRVLFSGEVMPAKHLGYWMSYLPEAEFVNLYGPTEITCNCTFHRIDRERNYEDGIPIGQPFKNERVFLLDAEDGPVTEAGVNGEICVAGSCLALGYYHCPEQTQKAFTQNPLNSSVPERIYRTGDLAYYSSEGELFFAGRKDFQIKYQGHRIELEEIERAMDKIPGMIRSCCIFDQEKERLYGFYTGTPEKSELHEILRRELPDYMVPARLTKVEEMPLTKNGKIDRKLLLSMAKSSRRRTRECKTRN